MSKRQRNMCILICLLILLIVLCTLSHMGSIKVTKPNPINTDEAHAVIAAPEMQNPIDFVITKEDQKLSLVGNLDSKANYERLLVALQNDTLSKEVNINTELASAEDVVQLTEKLLVPFMAKYSEGSIRYQNSQLIVDGTVENRADKNLIGSILANSTLPSVDNTTIREPIQSVAKVSQPPKVVEVMEINTTPIPVVEVNRTLPSIPEVPEVNITLHSVPTTPEVPKVEAQVSEVKSEEIKQIEAEIQKVIDFEHINFELDKADLTPKSLDTLQKIAEILKENAHIKVEIGGHTDSTGNDAHNLKLSQKRVNQVKEELILLGINGDRMTAIGFGETRPLVSNDTKENREKNRRVEFNIIGE